MDDKDLEKLVDMCVSKDLFREYYEEGYYCTLKPERFECRCSIKCEYLNLKREVHDREDVYFGCENNGNN